MFARAYMGRKRRAQPLPTLLLRGQKTNGQEQEPLVHGVNALEKSIFNPCTLTNMRHPSTTKHRGWQINSAKTPQSNLDKCDVGDVVGVAPLAEVAGYTGRS